MRAVGDLFDEGVLEGVLRLGVDGRLVDELCLHQRLQGGAQVALVDSGDVAQQRRRELPADHRRGLQHVLVPLGEPVNRAASTAWTVAGIAGPDGVGQLVGAPRTTKLPSSTNP